MEDSFIPMSTFERDIQQQQNSANLIAQGNQSSPIHNHVKENIPSKSMPPPNQNLDVINNLVKSFIQAINDLSLSSHSNLPPQENNPLEHVANQSVAPQPIKENRPFTYAPSVEQQPDVGINNFIPPQNSQRRSNPRAVPEMRENPNVNNFAHQGNNERVNIQAMIDEALLRSQFRNEFASLNESNKILAQVQLLESRKNSSRVLPKVKTLGYEWKIFYNSFLNTKLIFSPMENVLRVAEAISCKEILDLGGGNLMTPDTLENTLQAIDQRVGKPETLIISEKLKIIDSPKLKNGETKEIIEFIERVKKYSSLVDSIGGYHNKTDDALIARIHQILPERLAHSWECKFYKIRQAEGSVTISDLAKWLNEQIDGFESKDYLQKINPYGELRKKEGKPSHQREEKPVRKRSAAPNLNFAQNEISQILKESENVHFNQERKNFKRSGKPKSTTNSCWYHNNNQHPSFSCFSLLRKSGREVSELAKARGICQICSASQHEGPCPFKSSYVLCPIPDCNLRHNMLFCFKRQGDKTNVKNFSVTHKPKLVEGKRQDKAHEQNHLSHENENFEGSSQTINLLHSNSAASNNYSCNTITEIDFDRYEESLKEVNICQASITSKFSANLISVVVLTLTQGNLKLKGAFLLDSGSTTSMIDTHAAKMLRLDGPKRPLAVSWSGGKSRADRNSVIVRVNAKGIHKTAKSYELYFRTMQDLQMPGQNFDATQMKEKYPHLRKLDLESYSNVIGIIGTDQMWAFRQIGWVEASAKSGLSPSAMLTPLGYSIIGGGCPLQALYEHQQDVNSFESAVNHSVCHKNLPTNKEKELGLMQESVMGIEYLLPYENDRDIADEQKALEMLKRKVSKIPGTNRYQAPLLWKDEKSSLPTADSFKVAYS